MADPARAARLAQRIKVVVAEALRKAVKDERAEAITITDARVTNDLQHATVYYTVLGDAAAQEGAREVLDAKKGVLRREVGRNLTIRLTPTLEFVADEVPVNASHVEDLLRQARARDEEVARLAVGAQHAGDADPYKKPESHDDGFDGEFDDAEHESEFDGVDVDSE
ncbi:30S ribosome-binding factor RbfA [Sinomonas sp. ASV322]|uniref:30S ribosome-binding factor RbfA n=1 Tax=Sinomonas sp. ASV322 TaxID=3041920 RepID=UPI0027DB45EB|nr:30S ribosome-binding factor RbfA [Sinomonas sp. ASV322]MDQ4502715.1 30S ribosome-binding factor RbfA [Sinomonas sp. ASV322]